MITIKADQYVKDEGTGGKTIFTFTVTATDIFETGQHSNGNQAKVLIKLYEKGMDGADGLKLIADASNGVSTYNALGGSIVFDRDKDKKTITKETHTDPITQEKEEFSIVTYTKTIKVEVDADKNIEASEMFAVGLTEGWMMQDGKIVTNDFGKKYLDNGFPQGNFKVNDLALQVVRNDDGGSTDIDDKKLNALTEQLKKKYGTEQIDQARKHIKDDLKGDGAKEEPKPEEEKTTQEKLDDLKKELEKALEDYDRAGDEGRTEDEAALKKKVIDLFKKEDELTEKLLEEKRQEEKDSGTIKSQNQEPGFQEDDLDDAMIEYYLKSEGYDGVTVYADAFEMIETGDSAGTFNYFDYDVA